MRKKRVFRKRVHALLRLLAGTHEETVSLAERCVWLRSELRRNVLEHLTCPPNVAREADGHFKNLVDALHPLGRQIPACIDNYEANTQTRHNYQCK